MTGNIIGPPSATRDVVLQNLGDTSDWFRATMFTVLWDTAVQYGIDPVGMIAQSGKETNWGRYTGAVPDWFYNTAGIKVKRDKLVMSILGTTDPDHTLVHQQFPNWQIGAMAHAQHLLAYCGVIFSDPIVDPRWEWVFGYHQCVTWSDLNGKWAGPTYGDEIEAIRQRLIDQGDQP